jgi:hypothetical protein
VMLAQLAYADRTLVVDRIKMMNAPPTGEQLARYNLVLRWVPLQGGEWMSASTPLTW